jgi:hypothetical protein
VAADGAGKAAEKTKNPTQRKPEPVKRKQEEMLTSTAIFRFKKGGELIA